jgi:hypothetical protein
MKYLDVRWLHSRPSDPVRLVSEIDENNWEVRKLEFFADARVGYAVEGIEAGGTRLSVEPLPGLNEINAQVEFEGREIDAAAFENLWAEYARHAI